MQREPTATRLIPALTFDLQVLADLFTRGFEGYLVPIGETAEGLAARLRYDTIDLALSHVAMLDDRPSGFVWVAVRGWHCRIAGMGVAAEARRQGVGRRLMEAAIALAREKGLRKMVLEVIEQNEPAARLYRQLGFETQRRLVGYEIPAIPTDPADQSETDTQALVAVDPREVARRIAIEADADLPWQLAAETFGARSTGVTGFQLHAKAFALIRDPEAGAPGAGNPGAETMVLEALLVPRRARRAGWGSRLVRALSSRYPGRAWRTPARIPDDLAAPFFTGLGFEQDAISQLEMHFPLV